MPELAAACLNWRRSLPCGAWEKLDTWPSVEFHRDRTGTGTIPRSQKRAPRRNWTLGQVSSFIGTGPGQGHPAIPKEGAPEKLDTWPSVEFLITPRPRAESEHHSKRGRCVCAVGDSSPDAGMAFWRVEGGSRMKSSLVDAARGTGRRTARHVRPPGESGGRGKDPCTHGIYTPPLRSLSLSLSLLFL